VLKLSGYDRWELAKQGHRSGFALRVSKSKEKNACALQLRHNIGREGRVKLPARKPLAKKSKKKATGKSGPQALQKPGTACGGRKNTLRPRGRKPMSRKAEKKTT